MKYLPKFLQLLKEDTSQLALFANREDYLFITETVNLFYKMQVHKFTNEGMVELYKRGMTYKELAKVSGRPFQSVSTSINRFLTETDKKMSRKHRKTWVQLMNYITYVHATDLAGSWDHLTEKFPDKTLGQLKQMYRLSGGVYMYEIARIQRAEENERIQLLLDMGLSAHDISANLKMPLSTVYHRIDQLEGRAEDTEDIDAIEDTEE